MSFKSFKENLFQVVFPTHCINCGHQDVINHSKLCLTCYEALPLTNFDKAEEKSHLDKLFWGRVLVENTFAYLYFTENSSTQHLLHELKYKGQKDIGLFFGVKIGEYLKSNNILLDALIPVPLHHRKQFKRGFNQAECIAKGIQQFTDLKLDLKSIKRAEFTDSQTKKSLISRWENMKNKFVVSDSIKNYQHIALVDDVITTGSTLEAIIVEIRKVHPEIKISILSLAVTR